MSARWSLMRKGGSGSRKELFPILLNVDSGEGTDDVLDMRKVVMEGALCGSF